ncbi:peptide deformylase [Buchnera aphidicola (Chaitoregma tattakana)]|uniref:peptide deformylase n=1 Tax=Buchnera aphidicola TaxID=9 RepID=UPI0031B869EB
MKLLKILQYPNKNLRKNSKPVKEVNKYIQNIVDQMFYTMISENGIGLSGIQVNIPLQIITILDTKKFNKKITIINPKIIKKKKKILKIEGCLSFPNQQAIVPRYKYLEIEALNYFGKNIKIYAKSLLSICIQHEIDHLSGKLFIDHLSTLKKNIIKKKIEKINKKICKQKLINN